ncbi:MAG TPA: adenylate/guanylate cyclase domain-containing protein, partial [Gammaproteobacteria bacterium]|nr:adenylate/guanylate cyclase domain-containing protein [Gammaproteobacteria bacterium]
MESPAPGASRRTLICSVVFIDIVDYSKKTVAKQLAIKSWFNELLGQALASTASEDRLILDTGDGAAICFPGDPEEALFTANGLRVSLAERNYPELAFRIGINLGPVKVVKDINGRPNIIGDGINVAQRVMSFAEPNQILVSRSYYEVVSCLSEEYLRLFHYQGVRHDKHVRSHEVYEVFISAPGMLDCAEGARDADVTVRLQEAVQGDTLEPAVEFETSFLAAIAGELAKHIGPIATVVVQRAARRSATREELMRTLADAIPVPERRADFLSASGAPAAPGPATATAPSAQTTPAERPAGGVNEQLAARAEHLLAVHIGPMAKILVKKAARNARG